jgi:hypothetical protein
MGAFHGQAGTLRVREPVAAGMHPTSVNTSRQVMGALAALALAWSLAACGSTTSGAGGSGLCGQAGQVTRLVVKRGGLIMALGRQSAFRVKGTVTDPVKVRSVAEAACALPPMPSGAMSCPADSGLTYRLVFSVGHRELAPVSADATGCGEVKGLGETRWTGRSPGFWRALRKAEGE